jgi:hypothetical protein
VNIAVSLVRLNKGTVFPLIEPPGALFFNPPPEGGSNRGGGSIRGGALFFDRSTWPLPLPPPTEVLGPESDGENRWQPGRQSTILFPKTGRKQTTQANSRESSLCRRCAHPSSRGPVDDNGGSNISDLILPKDAATHLSHHRRTSMGRSQ